LLLRTGKIRAGGYSIPAGAGIYLVSKLIIMNRRKFLQSGSLAVMAAVTLPKAVRSMAKKPTELSYYRSKTTPDAQTQTVYEIDIDHYIIDSFDKASAEEKTLTLKVALFENANLSYPSKQGQFKYIITGSKKDENDMWTVSTKFDSKVSGDYTLEKSFPANIKLHCKLYNTIEIMDKKGKTVLQTLDYTTPPASGNSGASGCFLTTACVQHKQMADDCDALTTLRHLRDNFMTQTEEGNSMIAQYQVAGPAIVKAIDSCDNKAAIYDHMYTAMILPSVELVKQGRLKTAVEHYKLYVKALLEAYV